jgi:O-antigen/teichoic acid export membrane protein
MKALFLNNVFKNFSYLTLGSVVSQLLILVTVIKITNQLSPVDYGIYSFILSQGMLLHAVSDLGLQSIIIRSIARNPESTNSIVYTGSILRFTFLLIFILVYFIYNQALGNLNSLQVMIMGAYGITSSAYFLLEYVFVGNQKMLFPSIIKIVHSSIWIVTVFILPERLFTVTNLLYIYIILSCFQLGIMYFTLKKLSLFRGKPTDFFETSKKLLSESWPYISLIVLNLPFSHFANNFLDINSSTEEIGFFNLAQKLMNPVQIIVSFSATAIFPNISKLYNNDKDRFMNIVKNGLPLFVLVIGYLCFLYSLFSYDIISLVFDEKYLPAVKVAQLQIWFLFFNSINTIITIIIGASNLERKIFKISLICSLLGTPMIFYGSFYGALGMSYGYVVSFALFEFYLWYKLKKELNTGNFKSSGIWIFIAVLFGVSFFFPMEWSIILKLLTSIFITVLFYVFFKSKVLNFIKIQRESVSVHI